MAYLFKRFKTYLAVLFTVFLIAPAASFGADVDVYAEGAYTNTDLVVYIYADINTGPILSFGVKVEYPAGLTFSGATKNDSVWYFGDGGPDYPYMDPQNTAPSGGTPGNVIIIGGKLDTAPDAATDGVDGSRVLLGTVSFSHSGMTDFSGVGLTYAHGTGLSTDAFKNFVATNGEVKDGSGIGFAVKIFERGDANANGDISTADYVVIRNNIGRINPPPWIDCNADGNISTADYVCVRNKI